MPKPIKYVEQGLVYAAKAGWFVYDKINRSRKPGKPFTPKWSDKPLLNSYEKQKPPLGWPRTTDSLCPRCVPEIRQQILDGKLPHDILLNEKVGEIKATIIERDGKILMVKDCPKHGHFEDVMSIDPTMMRHIEEVFPGRDIRAHADEALHNHGTSTVKYGRGAVLTIDLTNRCNMMCEKELGRGDFRKIPNGGPGVEDRLSLVYHGGVIERGFSLNKWVDITSTASAKMFGMFPKKGTIAVGSDADIVIFNPSTKRTISAKTHHMNCDYSLFEGMEIQGAVETVLSRGKTIIENNRYLGRPGEGKFIKRGECAKM